MYRPNGDNKWSEAFSVWENETPGGDVIFQKMDTDTNAVSNSFAYKTELDKRELRESPEGSNGRLIGIVHSFSNRYHKRRHWRRDYGLTDITIKETYLLKDTISYDEYGQYLADAINLTHAAPKTIIKELTCFFNAKGRDLNEY